MYKTNKFLKIGIGKVFTLFLFMLVFIGRIDAQPTNYCDPRSPSGFTPPVYYYCWPAYYAQNYGWPAYYSTRIGNVAIKTTTGQTLFSNSTNPQNFDDPSCYKFFSTVAAPQLDLGDTYTFQIGVANVYGFYSYYCYSFYVTYYSCRLFIDWNGDGDFVDAGEWVNSPSSTNPLNPTPAWRGMYPIWNPSQSAEPYCSTNLFNYTYNVKIPETVDAQKVRMRILTSYYYPYSLNDTYDYGYMKFYNAAVNPCLDAYAYDYYSYGYSYVYAYGETEDYTIELQLPLKGTFPSDVAPNDILYAGQSYDGTTRTMYTEDGDPYQWYFEKPFVEFKGPQPSGMKIKYEIKGPMPSMNTVYTGLDGSGNNVIDCSGKTKIYINQASGSAAPGGNGALKISSGGEYQLWVTLVKPTGQEKTIVKKFTVSWLNDLACVEIQSPLPNGAPRFYKYPPDVPVPFVAVFQNVGLKNVTKFTAYARIYGTDGLLKRTITKEFDTAGHAYDVLTPKSRVTMDFGAIPFPELDKYRIEFEAVLKNATDLEAFNNILPRSTDPSYIFEVQAETEIGAVDILTPNEGSTIFAGRAIEPTGMIENFGVGDVSNVKAYMTFKLLPNGTPITKEITVPDVPSGGYNKKLAIFDGLILDEPGDYEVTFKVVVQNDYILTNNQVTEHFKVIGGLKDIVKVGVGQTYTDINSFMDALYTQGISGNLTVQFTDPVYHMYSNKPTNPAWDLSSFIMGLGYDSKTNTYRKITFAPSPQMATMKGSVKIYLHSLNGKGIFFGQNLNPSNPNAPVYYSPSYDIMRKFNNTPGYITFDGGSNKSIKVILDSRSSIQGQAFFLGRGSHDISIKNIIIENGTPAIANKSTLPRMKYSAADGFKYTKDSLELVDGNKGFSAGIANRGTLTPELFESNVLFIDTVQNSNNTFDKNEIYGFGYGIVSMGIGPLVNPRTFLLQRYYNLNNTISNNLIYDVEKGGVFAGFEENTQINGNRIYNVKSTLVDQSAGIEAGCYPESFGWGYNNVGLKIFNNEISGLADTKEVAGIKMLQNGQQFPDPLGGFQFFPNTNENFKVYNNIVWGIKNTLNTGSRYGIYVFTDRDVNVFTPKYPTFFGRNIFVANNTIVIPDDGINNTGNQAGIALMNFTGVQLYNNAIAISDNAIDNSSSQFDAAVVYQGLFPSASTFVSDNNAFWLGSNQNLSHFRFYEVNSSSQILEAGYNNEYKSLLQWQMWTKNDFNSVTGFNFLNDYQTSAELPQYFRIKNNPLPLGSVLNNRGKNLTDFTFDIDNVVRGDGGYPYDIGACEFYGRMYLRDVQPLFIVSPGNYRQTAPRTYSEAEYVMTKAPVDIVARITNPGSMLAVDQKVTVNIDVENPDGSYETVLSSTSKLAKIESFDTQNLSFGLADGTGTEFAPQSYYDLAQQGKVYNVPQQFVPMQENVTPVYRITVKAENDLNNDNNTVVKNVRFYVQKSVGYRAMVNAPSDLSPMPSNPNVNEIARRMNYDALKTGLKTIGFEKIPANNRYDFDYFNRDAWETRALDYTMYRTMFWSDGDNEVSAEGFDKYENAALTAYLNSGNSTEKKNFIMASQEYVRNNVGNAFGSTLTNYFRVSDKSPSNPMGANGNYAGYTVKGLGIARNLVQTVIKTDYPNDDYPKPGYFNMNNTSVGLAQIGYIYETLGSFASPTAPNSERIMAVATATQAYNSVYFGIDWRNFSNLDIPMRGILDFAEQNDGKILPVNLLSFNAEQAGSRVDINWITGTEFNSSHFDVEKASVKNNITSEFSKIATVNAAGKSGDTRNYGPVADKNIQFGETYAYRLKMVDKDGSFSYSDSKLVTIAGSEGTVWMSEVTPSPANSIAKVQLNISNSMNIDLAVFDLNGRRVLDVLNGTQDMSRELTINISSLPAGSYTLMLRSGEILITRSFTVVR